MAISVMEVDIWKGEWGLPSVDVHCLEVMVRNYNNHLRSSSLKSSHA